MKLKTGLATLGLFFLLACFTPHGIYHVVKPGQTLYTIAKTYNVELYKLMQVNNIRDPTRIKPGDRIFIPGATRQRYVPSTASSISKMGATKGSKRSSKNTAEGTVHKKQERIASVDVPRPDVEVRLPVVKKNEKKEKSPVPRSRKVSSDRTSGRSVSKKNSASGSEKKMVVALKVPRLIWPVEGRVMSRFGWRGHRHHDGIDIAAPEGTPVVAAADGIVIYSGNGFRGYGNLIVIKHTPRVFTIYAHNKKNLVRKGQKVRQGQTIALVGSTGRATGPHLHFELRIGNKPVDPLKYLPPR